MERFLIITNDGKDSDYEVTNHVKSYIESKGKVCFLAEKDEQKQIVLSNVPEQIDCGIVLGGDGTLIQVARELIGRNIPLVGVNLGTLGYLTEIEVHYVENAIDQLLQGTYQIENRMMLQGTFGEQTSIALNDIVITRNSGALRILHFDVYVNGSLLNSYQADGIIISTPTGSTAYNMSAGGPIVEPTAELIVITPICSHALNKSSIVLAAGDEITIVIGEGRSGSVESASAMFDGKDDVMLGTGDRITITKAEEVTRLVKLSNISFLEILRKKMKGS